MQGIAYLNASLETRTPLWPVMRGYHFKEIDTQTKTKKASIKCLP